MQEEDTTYHNIDPFRDESVPDPSVRTPWYVRTYARVKGPADFFIGTAAVAAILAAIYVACLGFAFLGRGVLWVLGVEDPILFPAFVGAVTFTVLGIVVKKLIPSLRRLGSDIMKELSSGDTLEEHLEKLKKASQEAKEKRLRVHRCARK